MGWLDNYGKKENENQSNISIPKGMVGMANDVRGRKFSPAWGGQFQGGGNLNFLQPTDPKLPSGRIHPFYYQPSSELATSIGGEQGEPAYLIPSFKYGKPLDDPLAEFDKTGDYLGGPFKTWQEADEWGKNIRHKYVEKNQTIPSPLKTWGKDYKQGGEIPPRVGAPSEGKYAKKTMPSAQDGRILPPLSSVQKYIEQSKQFSTPVIGEKDPSFIPQPGTAEYVPIEAMALPATPVVKGLGKVANMAIDALNPFGGIRNINVSKYNPWAFKPNPDAYYRGIGRTGYEDALKSGMVRPNPAGGYTDELYFTDDFKHTRMYAFDRDTYKGNPWEDDINDPWIKIPAKDTRRYVVEIPKKDIPNAKTTSPFPSNRKSTTYKVPYYTTKEFPTIDNVKFYKEHWLHGYKEIPKKENGGNIYYQTGQDFQPKTISQNGNTIYKVPLLKEVEIKATKPKWFEYGIRGELPSEVKASQVREEKRLDSIYPNRRSFDEVRKSPEWAFYKLLEPTGISSWPDIADEWNNDTLNMYDFTEPLSAIPLIGKIHSVVKGLTNLISFEKDMRKKQHGGVIKEDNMGYWNPENWGKPVRINSSNITMKGVPFDIKAVSNLGESKILRANSDGHKFLGTSVVEYPIAKNGSELKKLDQLINFTNYNRVANNWLDRYETKYK